MDRVLRRPLLLAAGCAVLFGIVLLAAYGPARGRWLDAAGLAGFVDLQSPLVADLTSRLARLGDPLPVGLAGAMLAVVALARGRPRLAGGVLLLLAATSVSSQVLKLVLAHPRFHESIPAGGQVASEAFPSGHATAAMSLALGAVLVAPRRLRPAAALLGAALAVAVGFSVVSLGWHFPSDVLGGYLLAAGWALVLVAALRRASPRELRAPREAAAPHEAAAHEAAAAPRERTAPRPGRERRTPRRPAPTTPIELAVFATALAVLAVVALAAVQLRGATEFPHDHAGFLAVAAAIATAALALPAGVAAALRRG
jgi:membrane-associated phospholipid phosphatase